jgi:hypothetical protein
MCTRELERVDSKHEPMHGHDIFVDLVIVWAYCCSCLELHCLMRPTKPGRYGDGDISYDLFFKLQQRLSSQLAHKECLIVYFMFISSSAVRSLPLTPTP